MAKQVVAGVMKKVVVRQKKGKKEWGSERDGEIQTHDTSMEGIEPPFSKYRVTEVL